MNFALCPDATSNFLGLFDLSIAPSLLFYSYIPIIIVSLFLGFFIFLKDKYSLQSKLLLIIILAFVIWVFDQIIQWTAIHVSVVHFAWQVIAFFEVLIPIFSIYFISVFLHRKDISFKYKIILGLMFLPIAIFLPTNFNISSFDLIECQSNYGYLWYYIYLIEIASVIIIMDMCFRKFKSLPKGDSFKKQILILAIGMFLFLGMFTLTNVLGDSTLLYEINLIGPIGMVIFFALMTYMIVRFGVFSIRLMAAQALVVAIIVLVGSQLFFVRTVTNRVLTIITLIFSCFGGYLLVRSVKKEVKQREELAKLNLDLKASIKQREALVHLVTHKVKGSFTRSKYIFAELLEGTFGAISQKVKDIVQKGLDSDNEGIGTVDLVLQADNLQGGLVRYDMKPQDFKEIVNAAITNKNEQAQAKHLKITASAKNGAYAVLGDAIWLKEVVNNYIDNAIKYSPQGEIKIALEKLNDKIRLSVKDTGVGLTGEDKANLFKAGGRGKESLLINVDSTGYGLYTVKMIADAHNGRVWAESEGKDKGSTFYLELPGQK